MKKILAIILILAVLCAGFAVPVYAMDGEISAELHRVISDASDDDLIPILFTVNTSTRYYTRFNYMYENGYDMDKYRSDTEYQTECDKDYDAYRQEYESKTLDEMNEIYKKLFGEDVENIKFCFTVLQTFIINATKSEILAAEGSVHISYIEYFDNSVEDVFETLDVVTGFCKEAYLLHMGISTEDESADSVICMYYGTADGLFVFRAEGIEGNFMFSDQKIGDYLLTYDSIVGPQNTNPIGMYVADVDGTVRTLQEAYDMGLIDIGVVADIVPGTYLYGDADDDKVLTIKDATYIQKIVAELKTTCKSRVTYSKSPDDMNLDGTVNIKDATAIQKHIAGIEY